MQLLLPVDKSAVTRFVNTFGEAKQMTAQQVEVAYRPGYVPKGHGPDFGVPEVVTAGIGYGECWHSSRIEAKVQTVHASDSGLL